MVEQSGSKWVERLEQVELAMKSLAQKYHPNSIKYREEMILMVGTICFNAGAQEALDELDAEVKKLGAPGHWVRTFNHVKGKYL